MHPLARALVLVVLACPVTTAAQTVSPTTPVHPSMPWSGITTPQGQLLRYIYVPPQPVMLEYVMPAPGDTPTPSVDPAPPNAEGETKSPEKPPEPGPSGETPAPGPQIVRQQVTVPGYYVRETTVGFHYPDRWAIEQVAANVYRWRQIPAQFIPK